MDVTNYFGAVTKWWISITCALFVSLIIALGPTLLTPPTYQANTQLFISTQTDAVNPNQQLFQGGNFSVDRVSSYAELTSTPRVLEPVIRQLELTTSAEELASQVSTDIPAGTVLIEVQIRDGTPESTAVLANAVGAQLGRVIEELETPGSGPPSPVKATILKQAIPPVDPIWPSPPMNLTVGLMAGLLLGVGIVVLREKLNVTVKGAADLARLTDLPVLATIVLDTSETVMPIVRGDPHSRRSEAYRQLRTNLQFAFVDDEPRVVTVTSAVPGEGRTSVAGNLALSLQQLGSRICLLDGDLRRPSVAECFGLPGEAGLTSVLVGRAEIEDVIQTVDTGLDIVASGPIPPNPSELLASGRMTTVLRELSLQYDMVVVDSTPSLPFADASVLASRSSGTLYVIHAGSTGRHQVELALRGLRHVNARMLGTVLNMAPPKGGRLGDYGHRDTYRPVMDPTLTGAAPPVDAAEPLRESQSEQTVGLRPADARGGSTRLEPSGPSGSSPDPDPARESEPRYPSSRPGTRDGQSVGIGDSGPGSERSEST